MNAGVRGLHKAISKSNHEVTIQVDHLSTALLTFLLLPYFRNASKLPGSFPARLTIISSCMHTRASLSTEQRQPNIFTALSSITEKRFDTGDYYNTSKIFNVAWNWELASRVNADEVIINAVNPGFCVTNILREDSYVVATIIKAPRDDSSTNC